MRLTGLKIEGFRGFGGSYEFDLDADAIVVVGANGNGKTSLFDAILWVVSGKVPRLGGDDGKIVSMYSETGRARVELGMRSRSDEEYSIVRTSDGSDVRLTVKGPGGVSEGSAAIMRTAELLWPAAAAAADVADALANIVTLSVYLQQDLVRQFLDASTDGERFNAVSELVGAGRVTELQVELESEKKAWTQTTNQLQVELQSILNRLEVLDARAAELAVSPASSEADIGEAWSAWVGKLPAVGVEISLSAPEVREASGAVDAVLKQLAARRKRGERSLQELLSLKQEYVALQSAPSLDPEPERRRVAALTERVGQLRAVVVQEENRARERRQLLAELKNKDDQLRALAGVALTQLGDRCPVCAQTYDREETRRRLEIILRQDPTDQVRDSSDDLALIASLKALSQAEAEAQAAARQLATIETEWNTWRSRVDLLHVQLGRLTDAVPADGESVETALEAHRDRLQRDVQEIENLYAVGEQISMRISDFSAAAAIKEVEAEAAILRKEVAEKTSELDRRTRTGNLAQRIIASLREASAEVVGARLETVGPTLQSMYARIDPHPSFRSVSFLSRFAKGRGKLATVIADPAEGKRSESPGAVLSSSQLNALAVCVFLTLSTGLTRTPLSVSLLDDPLQSLDDINLLGLLDLLRRVKATRQLIVSTHDDRFGNLLARKLRPKAGDGRTVTISLKAWERRGPQVEVNEIHGDPSVMRLVASY